MQANNVQSAFQGVFERIKWRPPGPPQERSRRLAKIARRRLTTVEPDQEHIDDGVDVGR